MLQETEHLLDYQHEHWVKFSSLNSKATTFAHSSLVTGAVYCTQRSVTITIANIAFTNSYMPNTLYGVAPYMQETKELLETGKKLREHKIKHHCLATDAQVCVPPLIPGITGDQTCDPPTGADASWYHR